MLRPDSLATGALLTALVALGPISTDMTLPSLPAMVRAFDADVGVVQFTLSAFMLGWGLSHLVYGPLSDRMGRRPVILAGVALYFAATILCTLAPGVEALILGRFFQGMGACVGNVLARAVVRDVHGRDGSARVLAYIGAAMALAPMVAPALGGQLVTWFGWRAVFVFFSAYGGLMFILVAALLVETNRWRDPEATRPGRVARTYRDMLASPAYLGYVLVNAFAFAGLFAFSSGSSFVFIDLLGLSPTLYGLCFGTVIGGYVAGALISARWTGKVGIDRLLTWGSLVALGSGLVLAVLAWTGDAGVAVVMVPMFVFLAAFGLINPNAMAGALGPHQTRAGAASALFGLIQMILAAAAGVAVGQLDDGTQVPMTTTVALMGALACLSYFTLVRRRGEIQAR